MPDAQTRHGHQITKQAKRNEKTTWNQEEPTGAAHQKIAQRAPAIPKCFQMWRVRCASVGIQSNRDLGNFFAAQAGFDDHLRCELHSSATQIEPVVHGLGKTAQATVNIIDRGMEPFPDKKRKKWIANPAMQKRHRAGSNGTTSRWKP